MAGLTALAALARTVLEAARALGVRTDDLLELSGLDPAVVAELDGRVDSAGLLRLWELVAERSGDRFFGLHAGERFVAAKTVHIVGHMARNSSTLGDCYERSARFGALTNEASEIALRIEKDRAVMRVGPLPGAPPWPRVYAEMALAAYVSLGRKWTGTELSVVEATFQHPAPADVSEYTRIFGPNVRFAAAHNEIVFTRATLDLPLREPDPALREYLEVRAAALLDNLREGHDFENLVRTKIDARLSTGTPSVDEVARELAMSSRTLQRRLSEEGLSFTALVEDVRKRAALSLVKDPRISVSEIAALVGYRDVASFRAAFHRWTGTTPRDARRRTD